MTDNNRTTVRCTDRRVGGASGNGGCTARPCRSVWISDVHLGARQCRADRLLSFLRTYDSDHLYLVGDIFDTAYLGLRWHWTEAHTRVVEEMLRKARNGTRVTYIPGNHDRFLRVYEGVCFEGIRICKSTEHVTAAGERLLVCHGDEFDVREEWPRWKAVVGTACHSIALMVNFWVNLVRRCLGRGEWTASVYFKKKLGRAADVIARYANTAMQVAEAEGADGVVCGHIHEADIRCGGAVAYYNTGDWLENSTALIERWDGTMELLDYSEAQVPDASRRFRSPLDISLPAQPLARQSA